MKLYRSFGAMAIATLLLALPAGDLARAHTDLVVLVNFGGSAACAQMLALPRPWHDHQGQIH